MQAFAEYSKLMSRGQYAFAHCSLTIKMHYFFTIFHINSGFITIKGQSFDPGFYLNGNPLHDQWDGTTIVSTNQENK